MKKKKWIVPFFIVLLIAVTCWLLLFYKAKPRARIVKAIPVTVNVLKVKAGHFQPGVLVYGTVDSSHHASLKSELDTTVERVRVRDGEFVKTGDTLMTLDRGDVVLRVKEAQATVKEAQAQVRFYQKKAEHEAQSLQLEQKLLDLKKTTLKRNQDLHGAQAISASALDNQRSALYTQQLQYSQHQKNQALDQIKIQQWSASLLRARAALQLLIRQQSSAVIKAPFDGVVTQLHVAQGAQVTPGQLLMKLMGTKHIEVRALIPSSYDTVVDALLKAKQKLKAHSYLNGQPLVLTLRRLAAQVKPGQIGREAVFSADRYQNGLVHQRTISLVLDFPPVQRAFVVPDTALYQGKFVYRVKNKRLQSCPVQLSGRWYRGQQPQGIIVTSPSLQSGDLILTSSIPNAIEGLLVKPVLVKRDD